MLVDRFLRDSARRAPDRAALIEVSRTTSYADLDRLTKRFANLCVAEGVQRGDRVVVAGENSCEFVAAYIGAMRSGAVAVPLPSGPRNDRFAKAIRDAQPALCVVDTATAADATCREVLSGVPAVFVKASVDRAADATSFGRPLSAALTSVSDEPPHRRAIDRDLAAIVYTSGSTGEPRGVMLTHRNIVANTRSIIEYLRLSADDRAMCVLPFFYVYGLSVLHTHLAVGGSIIIDNRFAYPSAVLKAIRDHGATGFAGVPSTFAVLLNRPDFDGADLRSLRYITQAGGSMPAPRIREWRERVPDVPFYVMYGATEASARLTYLDPSSLERKLGSIGRPIPNVDIEVVKEDGTKAATGETGELVARGSNISCGYWNDAEETNTRFSERGYRTGDLGYVDEEGFLFLVGRRHDMIKTGAHRVSPKEIEEVVSQHPAVQEVVVLGMPHEILGEVPVAFVVVRHETEATGEMFRAFCSTRLPSHKVPAQFVFRGELPKIAGIGKIDRRALFSEVLG
jgi:amino acid adenylation domain-containing protein